MKPNLNFSRFNVNILHFLETGKKMQKFMLILLVAVLVMASAASADTFRFMQSGNWEDSQWQKESTAPPL